MEIYKLNFTILELEIFLYLSLRSGERFSQRDIAFALKVSPTAISNSVQGLTKKGLISLEKIKNINFIMFNRDNPRAIELKRSDNLKLIYISGLFDTIEHELAGSTIILFGSYSKGEDIGSSDIDIAVIGRNHKKIYIEGYEKKLFRKININFYKSWKEIDKNLKNNILNGIILCGSVDI